MDVGKSATINLTVFLVEASWSWQSLEVYLEIPLLYLETFHASHGSFHFYFLQLPPTSASFNVGRE